MEVFWQIPPEQFDCLKTEGSPKQKPWHSASSVMTESEQIPLLQERGFHVRGVQAPEQSSLPGKFVSRQIPPLQSDCAKPSSLHVETHSPLSVMGISS